MATNNFSKKKSKRMTCKQKYKIEKKVREHNRKVRKGIIKNKRNRSKKDPGVPNLAPFKEKVLQEAEEDKKTALALKQKKKQEARERKKTSNGDAMDNLLQEAKSKCDEFEEDTVKRAPTDSSAKAFYKDFKKVVDEADVIIEVLDARDPMGTRSRELEHTVLAAGSSKHLVLLLNKADLVPKENLKGWVTYLRAEHPTLAFKASTQRQTNRLAQSSVDVLSASEGLRHSQNCLGASALLQLLSKYSLRGASSGQTPVVAGVIVGLVGMPNVGKSSVINSLKRARACGVGGVAGVTRALQTVRLDAHVQLIDSPGLVLTSGGDDQSLALRNAVSVQRVSDPLACASAVLARVERRQLMLHYRLPEFSDTTHMLALLAKRQGRLKPGGAVDVEAAARAVLHDWNTGRICYHTSVPDRTAAATTAGCGTEVVSEMADAFPLLAEDLESMDAEKADVLPDISGEHGTQDGVGGRHSELVISLGSESKVDASSSGSIEPPVGVFNKSPARLKLSATSDGTEALSKKTYRQAMKKKRKIQARNIRKVDALSDQLSGL